MLHFRKILLYEAGAIKNSSLTISIAEDIKKQIDRLYYRKIID